MRLSTRRMLVVAAMVSAVQASAQDRPLNPNIDKLFPETPKMHLMDMAQVVENPSVVNAALQKIKERDTLNLVAVTLPTIGQYDIADVAREIGRRWKIAQETGSVGLPIRHTGGVILLVMDTHKCRVETATGSEGYMTDNAAAEACRGARSYFRSDKFGLGILSIASVFDGKHIVAMREARSPAKPRTSAKSFPWFLAFGIVFVFGAIAAIVARLAYKRSKRLAAAAAIQEQQEMELRRKEDAIRRRDWAEVDRQQQIDRQKAARREHDRWEALTPAQRRAELDEQAAETQRVKERRRLETKKRKTDEEDDSVHRNSSYTAPDYSSNDNSTNNTDTIGGGADAFNGGGGGDGW
jgi:uncharacterized membrane protein YgcG